MLINNYKFKKTKWAYYQSTLIGFSKFGRYLNETGRPMIYSCCWPFYQENKGIPVSGKIIKKQQ